MENIETEKYTRKTKQNKKEQQDIDLSYTHTHDDVTEWKYFRVNGTLWGESTGSPMASPHKGQWRGKLMFSLICAWTNGSENNRYVVDLRRHCAHYDATVMKSWFGYEKVSNT